MVVLLAMLAVAGALAVWGLVVLARSGVPRRASWLLVRTRMIADCEKTNLARGVEAGLTRRYCACLQGAVESRWNSFDYRNRYRTHVREMEADGTLARCAERVEPSPPSAAQGGADARRLGWESARAAMRSECASIGRQQGWPEDRTKIYCACMMDEVETRWSADEYRTRYQEITQELLAGGGAVERCARLSEDRPSR